MFFNFAQKWGSGSNNIILHKKKECCQADMKAIGSDINYNTIEVREVKSNDDWWQKWWMELPFENNNLQTTYVSLGDINGDVRRRGLYDIPARPSAGT